MKLDEARRQILDGDLSPQARQNFYDALDRVHEPFLKCQHCYLLAHELWALDRIKNLDYALDLTDCALLFYDSWSVRERVHDFKAHYYEYDGQYDLAEQQYQSCADIFRNMDARYAGKIADYSFYLMRNELKRSGFTYTGQLAVYYDDAYVGTAPSLNAGFKNVALYRYIAHILLARHRGDQADARTACDQLLALVCGSFQNPYEAVFQRSGIQNELELGKEERAFIERCAAWYR